MLKDMVVPGVRWEFDEAVTDAFDDMLRRSIPQYNVMRQACLRLAAHYRQPDTDVLDLGCSRGQAIADLMGVCGDANRFLGVDISKPMLDAARQRFASVIADGRVSIEELDLCHSYPQCRASVTFAVLTLQFIPPEHRPRIVQDVYRHTVDGGVFIMVEKVLGATPSIDTVMVECYHRMKARHGYSQEAIERKRLALRGVLVPATARLNEELLRSAGFRQVDCFWRWMNFAGWVAVK
ncbi:MAG: methyltransferase domain-containing protein [Gemmatimonadetes bacterium]|nr:methyltransferase domain-containing protein [Gemmatimonadota bacterium]